MSHFIVDAPLLACPDPNQGTPDSFQGVFKAYLARLSSLELLRSTCRSTKFWRDEQLSVVLAEQNCYPFRHRLCEAVGHLFDPLEFQIEDINRVATALLDRSMRLEESGDIVDVVVSDCSVYVDPAPNRHQRFLEHLCRQVALALPILGDGVEFFPNTYLTSCGEESSPACVAVNFKLDLVELGDGAIRSELGPVSVEVENYRGATSFFGNANLTAWWANASEESIKDACAIHVIIGLDDPWERMRLARDRIAIGTEFVSSAKALGFMHEAKKIDRLLRVCGDLLAERNLANSHWLRTGRGANDPQRVTGLWKAWRHDIDHEFHLHYWRCGNQIKLANVVVHNDFDIGS